MEILGQFDNSCRGNIKTLYRYEEDGKLLGVTFNYQSKAKVGWGDAACEFICVVQIRAVETDIPIDDIEGREFALTGDELLKVRTALPPHVWKRLLTNDSCEYSP